MYRNMQKIDRILYNLDCLICDNNKSLRDLIYINEESGYDKYQKKVIIKLNGKEIIVEDFNELKNEWLNFICDIFSEVFLSKEEEGPYGTYC